MTYFISQSPQFLTTTYDFKLGEGPCGYNLQNIVYRVAGAVVTGVVDLDAFENVYALPAVTIPTPPVDAYPVEIEVDIFFDSGTTVFATA